MKFIDRQDRRIRENEIGVLLVVKIAAKAFLSIVLFAFKPTFYGRFIRISLTARSRCVEITNTVEGGKQKRTRAIGFVINKCSFPFLCATFFQGAGHHGSPRFPIICRS